MPKPIDKQVIDIQSRRRQRTRSESPMGTLIKACHKFAHNTFDEGMEKLFEGADDALFDLAERAQSNTRQADFFEGMRDVRLKRVRVERSFEKALIDCFRAYAKRQLNAPETTSETPVDLENLTLVTDNDLEETLAISGMVSKATTHASRALAALNKRLAVVHGGSRLTNNGNPVAPIHVAECFRQAATELESALTVKLVLFKLFEKHVLSRLPALYDQINQHLSNAGILSGESAVLTRPVRRAPATRASANDTPEGGALLSSDVVDGIDGNLLEQLHSLLASRHGSRITRSTAAQPHVDQQDLLTALTLLQAEQTGLLENSQNTRQSWAPQPLAKSQLISQVSRLSANPAAGGLSVADDDTIELVGMLFEFILRDNTLPDQIKAIISRLQVPLIKVALMDKHLFAQRNHPARRLLDELANIGIGWSETADRGGKLLTLIKDVVEQVLREFDDDFGTFEVQLQRVRGFAAERARKVQRTEQRTAESTEGRERLERARKDAAKAVFDRLQGHLSLPPVLGKLLRTVWPNVLVLKMLRHGQESEEYRASLAVVEQLIATTSGQRLGETPAQHNSALLSMHDEISAGLDLVAYQERDVQSLLDRLTGLDDSTHDGEDAGTDLDASSKEPALASPDTEILGHTQTEIESPEEPSVAALVSEHTAELSTADANLDLKKIESDVKRCMGKLKKLEVGNWVEFSRTDDTTTRAKLSWISPISDRYLFVNRNGLKICDLTLKQLAVEMSLGHLSLLAETPLFERAVGAILKDLKSGQIKPMNA